jgi:hypothetical protein
MCRVSGRGKGGQGVPRLPLRLPAGGVLGWLGRRAFALRPSAGMQALREFYPTNGVLRSAFPFWDDLELNKHHVLLHVFAPSFVLMFV